MVIENPGPGGLQADALPTEPPGQRWAWVGSLSPAGRASPDVAEGGGTDCGTLMTGGEGEPRGAGGAGPWSLNGVLRRLPSRGRSSSRDLGLLQPRGAPWRRLNDSPAARELAGGADRAFYSSRPRPIG